MTILLVAVGGALGAVLRYASVAAAARIWGAGFPYGVMGINILGSFLMGVAAAIILEKGLGGPNGGALLMTGVLGGFTTFSAFSLDAVRLMETGRADAAALYVFGSVAGSLAAIGAGLFLTRWAVL